LLGLLIGVALEHLAWREDRQQERCANSFQRDAETQTEPPPPVSWTFGDHPNCRDREREIGTQITQRYLEIVTSLETKGDRDKERTRAYRYLEIIPRT
jgi:hypothetical protein